LAAVFSSVIINYGAIILVYGGHLDGEISVSTLANVTFWMSAGTPALICPLITYQILRLLRERNHARDALERLSQTDQLTGLPNRRGFDQSAFKILSATGASGQPIAVLMCDIDFFKKVNDEFGHDFGDAALRHVADVMRVVAGDKNVVLGRQGGEEFVVLLPGYSRREAMSFAEKLRQTCAARPVVWFDKTTRITMSIGVAAATHRDGPLSQLFRVADAALYKAKREGRDRVVGVGEADEVASAA
jgi:diguanylate cyclase (GGDEF)-like protein